MPSREEIAGWLREAGEKHCIGHKYPTYSKLCEERSLQIVNMRCETCERYVPGEDDESCTFNQIEYQGPGFGCWFHKSKEK